MWNPLLHVKMLDQPNIKRAKTLSTLVKPNIFVKTINTWTSTFNFLKTCMNIQHHDLEEDRYGANIMFMLCLVTQQMVDASMPGRCGKCSSPGKNEWEGYM